VLIIERELEGEKMIALFNFGDQDYPVAGSMLGAGKLALSSRPLKENLLNNNVLPKRTGVWVCAG
jgi:hypothetical protein